jgi:ribose/xylose/arabinose/galactoside ABC-type transport system permease subunit
MRLTPRTFAIQAAVSLSLHKIAFVQVVLKPDVQGCWSDAGKRAGHDECSSDEAATKPVELAVYCWRRRVTTQQERPQWVRTLTATGRPWLTLALVCALFSLHAEFRSAFWQTSYLPTLLQQSARNIVLAVGMSFVILTGGIDLSVGSVLGLCGVALAMGLKGSLPRWLAFVVALPFAVLVSWQIWRNGACLPDGTRRVVAALGFGVVFAVGGLLVAQGAAGGLRVEGAILLALLVGAACGLVNGLVVSIGRVPSFVVTLGMLSAARGLTLYATDGNSVPCAYPRLMTLGQGNPLVIITLLVVAAGTILLNHTRAGRNILAIGGNEQASYLTGVDVVRYKTLAYMLAGSAAAVAALLAVAKFGTASTDAGSGAELEAIAAVVIGGTSLSGGQGSIIGALVGALTITVIEAGLVLVGIKDTLQPVILGGVIVLTVFVDQLRRRQ